MADAVWNGFLRVSLVSCPVALSPAVKEGNGVRLDQLNARTGNPVTQQFLDAKTGVVVPSDALAQGCQVEGGGYVAISDAELATVAGEPSDVVELALFVPRDQTIARSPPPPITSIQTVRSPATRCTRCGWRWCAAAGPASAASTSVGASATLLSSRTAPDCSPPRSTTRSSLSRPTSPNARMTRYPARWSRSRKESSGAAPARSTLRLCATFMRIGCGR
jgi:hypothetical protein